MGDCLLWSGTPNRLSHKVTAPLMVVFISACARSGCHGSMTFPGLEDTVLQSRMCNGVPDWSVSALLPTLF